MVKERRKKLCRLRNLYLDRKPFEDFQEAQFAFVDVHAFRLDFTAFWVPRPSLRWFLIALVGVLSIWFRLKRDQSADEIRENLIDNAKFCQPPPLHPFRVPCCSKGTVPVWTPLDLRGRGESGWGVSVKLGKMPTLV